MKVYSLITLLALALTLPATQALSVWPFSRTSTGTIGEVCKRENLLTGDRIKCLKRNVCSTNNLLGKAGWKVIHHGITSSIFQGLDIDADIIAAIGSGTFTSSEFISLASHIATVYGRDPYDERFFQAMGLTAVKTGVIDGFVSFGFYQGVRELTKTAVTHALPGGKYLLQIYQYAPAVVGFVAKEGWDSVRCEGDFDALVSHVVPKLLSYY